MKPAICPVCLGNGFVPNGFYSTTNREWASGSTEPEVCRSCNGKGCLFVMEDEVGLIYRIEGVSNA